jgi:hypothetical protein
MLVGIASGTYSSIFIASPVLTAWKEREPGFIRRRLRIAEAEGGAVPAFADDMDVARLGGEEEPGEGEGAAPEPAAEVEEAAAAAEPGAVATAERTTGNGGDPAPEFAAAEAESAERRQRNEERRARRQARRKHGRNR